MGGVGERMGVDRMTTRAPWQAYNSNRKKKLCSNEMKINKFTTRQGWSKQPWQTQSVIHISWFSLTLSARVKASALPTGMCICHIDAVLLLLLLLLHPTRWEKVYLCFIDTYGCCCSEVAYRGLRLKVFLCHADRIIPCSLKRLACTRPVSYCNVYCTEEHAGLGFINFASIIRI